MNLPACSSIPTDTNAVEPSQVTRSLVLQLTQRDAKGQSKYGTSLDRNDLTPEEWSQHAVEELLDGAGYLTALIRDLGKIRAEMAQLRKAAQEYALLRKGLNDLLRAQDRPLRYVPEETFQEGFRTYEKRLQDFLLEFDSAQVLRQMSTLKYD